MLDDKNLRQQILNEVNDDSIPNFATSIKQKHLNNIEAKKPWYKKGLTWAIGTPVVVMTAACIAAVTIIIGDNGPQGVTSHSLSLVGKKNEIAFGVVSINNLLSLDNPGDINNLAMSKTVRHISSSDLSEIEFKKQMEYLNPYMLTAEEMLDNSLDLKPEVIKLENQEYAYQMTINTNDEEPLIFLYNETSEAEVLAKSSIRFEDDDDDESEDEAESEEEEKDDDDEEQEYSLNGIINKGEITYYVDGEKELNPQENEYELELFVYDNEKRDNLILSIEQEIESSGQEQEQSYKYTKYENGEKILVTDFGFEQEEDEIQIEVEIFADNKTSVYSIKKVDDTKFAIDYEYEKNDSSITVNKKQVEANMYYSYKEETLNYIIDLLIK